MSLRTPMARVKGLGSAKQGLHHWWQQRLSALALIPLSLWFMYSLLTMSMADYVTVVQWLRLPYVSVLLIFFVLALFYHAQLGLQVIIEDYIDAEWQKIASIILVKFLAILGSLSAIVSIMHVFVGSMPS